MMPCGIFENNVFFHLNQNISDEENHIQKRAGELKRHKTKDIENIYKKYIDYK